VEHNSLRTMCLWILALTIGSMAAFAQTSFRIFFPAAGCGANVPASGYDLPTGTNAAPKPNCYGTSYRFGALAFTNSASQQSASFYMKLPVDWTATNGMQAVLHWFVPGTTPTAAQWTVTGKCIGAGDNLINPSLAAGTPVIYPSIGQNLLNVTGVVTLSTDGCTAGRVLLVKVAGNPTVAGTAISLIGVEITIRRSPLP
jgi:hypothetical protein